MKYRSESTEQYRQCSTSLATRKCSIGTLCSADAATGEVNLYPRLDLQLRPTRVPQLNEVSYGEEYEEGLEGPTSPRVIEKLRRAKEFTVMS